MISPDTVMTPKAFDLSSEANIDLTGVDRRKVAPYLSAIFESMIGTTAKPPFGYHIPWANSAYCNKEYVPGASNGDIPMYNDAKVNVWRSREETKYLETR